MANRNFRYSRISRVNEILREIVAEELERIADVDERLGLLTVMGIDTSPDLRHATVFYSSLEDGVETALTQHRVRLQKAIAAQTRLKRTPQLKFVVDPAMVSGQRIEEIIDSLHDSEES